MYEILIAHRWFSCGKSYDQRIGITPDVNVIPLYINKFLEENPQFKNHQIYNREIKLES